MKKNTDRALLSPSMKMAELMDIDFSLLGVLTRMGLSFGFGEATVEEVCRKGGINPESFLLICEVYAYDGYLPPQSVLEQADLKEIVNYLHRSHAYYMEVAMLELSQALERMIQPCDKRRQSIIRKFFEDYKGELSKHFEYEENQVFPYVYAMLDHKKEGQFTIGEYEQNHSNVEEKLEDLKNLVMKYMPLQCSSQEAFKALFYIYSLELDLRKHTIIEDKILVPMVGRMEHE